MWIRKNELKSKRRVRMNVINEERDVFGAFGLRKVERNQSFMSDTVSRSSAGRAMINADEEVEGFDV